MRQVRNFLDNRPRQDLYAPPKRSFFWIRSPASTWSWLVCKLIISHLNFFLKKTRYLACWKYRPFTCLVFQKQPKKLKATKKTEKKSNQIRQWIVWWRWHPNTFLFFSGISIILKNKIIKNLKELKILVIIFYNTISFNIKKLWIRFINFP